MPIPTISAEETDWGLAENARAPTGEVKTKQWGVPNKAHVLESVGANKTQYKDVIHWRVPIDDEHTLSISQALVPLTGEDARRYRERHAEKADNLDMAALVEDILAGTVRIQELYDTHPDLSFNSLEHSILQVGQGTIADRTNEFLGATDVSVILFRKILARELQALAEGRPLTQWAHTDRIVPTEGDMGRRVLRTSEDFDARLRWAAAR